MERLRPIQIKIALTLGSNDTNVFEANLIRIIYTDRQIVRKIDRQLERQIDRQKDRQIVRKID